MVTDTHSHTVATHFEKEQIQSRGFASSEYHFLGGKLTHSENGKERVEYMEKKFYSLHCTYTITHIGTSYIDPYTRTVTNCS